MKGIFGIWHNVLKKIVTGYWITESHSENCIVCRKLKKGRFLIINIPNNKYLAVCEKCVMA